MFDIFKKWFSIREGTFETNSSSMHALVVANRLASWKKYHSYVKKEIKRWLQPDGSYLIEIQCRPDDIDAGDFSIRRYIPHKSINDKLIYLLGVIIEHYKDSFVYPPYDKSNWVHPENEKDEEKKKNLEELKQTRHEEYLKERKHYKKVDVPNNLKVYEQLQETLKTVEDNIETALRYFMHRKDEKQPKIEVHFKTYLKDNYIRHNLDDSWDYFSLGCYEHEEFYAALIRKEAHGGHRAGEWICNPYSQILAGSSEMDEEEKMQWETDAQKLIEESYELSGKYFAEEGEGVPDWIDPEDVNEYKRVLEIQKKTLRVNRGKVIFPVGG